MTIENCSICTENLENKNRVFLDCGHSFHCTCIFRLFNHNDKKCPNCRQEIKYEVPVSEQQERLTRQDNTIKELTEQLTLVATEHFRLQKDHEEALKSLVVNTQELTKLKLEHTHLKLQHKLKMEMKELERKNILSDLIKLSSEVQRLKKRAPQTIIQLKNNKIKKLETTIRRQELIIHNLNDELYKNCEKNINNAEKYDEYLDTIKLHINKLKSENTKLRNRARLSQPSRPFIRNNNRRL